MPIAGTIQKVTCGLFVSGRDSSEQRGAPDFEKRKTASKV
jgi:hypothetical protein